MQLADAPSRVIQQPVSTPMVAPLGSSFASTSALYAPSKVVKSIVAGGSNALGLCITLKSAIPHSVLSTE